MDITKRFPNAIVQGYVDDVNQMQADLDYMAGIAKAQQFESHVKALDDLIADLKVTGLAPSWLPEYVFDGPVVQPVLNTVEREAAPIVDSTPKPHRRRFRFE